MRRQTGAFAAVFVMLLFICALALESSAWARAGRGSSSGSRGSRSFSAPSMPSRPSPTPGAPQSPGMGVPGQSPFGSPGTGFGRSPFMQGMLGGLAGGFLGNMLFGGRGYASPGGGYGGGGVGLLDLIIIGAVIYFGFRYFRRRRIGQGAYYEQGRTEDISRYGTPYFGSASQPPLQQPPDELERGLEDIRKFDPSFSVETFAETTEDMFFRIQAAWMNRSMEGVENLLSPEMKEYFREEFARMKQEGRINRLENIAVRKVEPAEAWQESGKDYITVFFTANLLDYTTDESGKVVEGDKLNPVKFQEFWTFCRDIGARQWQLTAINQIGEPSPH